MSGVQLRIDGVQGPAWVQDLGRPGHMHEGVPWGGALVPELLLAANLALGNQPQAAGIEFFGSLRLTLPPGRALAQDGRRLEGALDAPLRPAAGARVSYVAVAGGVDCPAWFGGRGTLVATGLGGWQGRPLRRGDALPLGAAGTLPAAAQGRLVAPAPDANSVTALRVYPGPDAAMLGAALQAALWRQLLATCWCVGRASDRSGTVLEGPPLALPQGVAEAAASAPSRPMVAGAIQLPPSGQPIVLGPDHPVTGGYPLIGVLRRQDLGALQLRCPGAALRLRAA